MNYVIRELTLYRHFLLIDSPIPFEFIANPTNYNKDMSDFSRVTGLDVCSRPSGCWRVDCWKLLPKEFQRNNPVFTMLLKYDADLLGEGETVDVRYSDIDVGEGVAGVNGQLVQILPSTFQPVIGAVNNFGLRNHSDIDALKMSNSVGLGLVKSSVDALQTSNHADLLGVKSSVDALQTSNHADLLGVKSSVDALQTSNHADLLGVKSSVDALQTSNLSKGLFLPSSVSYISLIPITESFFGSWAGFSMPFFDTFISLRYEKLVEEIPGRDEYKWFDNWIFVPRGVRFLISVRFESSRGVLIYTVTYPVDGVDVSKTYTFETNVMKFSVNVAVPSVLI